MSLLGLFSQLMAIVAALLLAPQLSGSTAVTLRMTAVALPGTPPTPATCSVRASCAPNVRRAVPSPLRVSAIRTGLIVVVSPPPEP